MRPPLRLPLFPSPTLFRSPGAHTAAGRVCEVRHQPPQVGQGYHSRSHLEPRLDQANSRPRDSETEPGAGGSAGRAAAIVREGLAQGRSAHSQLERCLCTERRDSNEQDGRNREDVPHTASHTRSEEHTSELQSQSNLVCRLLLEKKKISRQGLLSAPHPSEIPPHVHMGHSSGIQQLANLRSPLAAPWPHRRCYAPMLTGQRQTRP